MRMYEEYAAGTLPLDTYKQKLASGVSADEILAKLK